MDLAAMRLRFREGCADRAMSLSDPEVDLELNRAWRYTLPDTVNGTSRDGSISFALQAGKQDYNLDVAADVGTGNAGLVREIKIGIRFNDMTTKLDYYDDFDFFYDRFVHNDAAQGRPGAVLVWKRTLTFRPVPDVSAYTVVVPASLYNVALTADGISNDTLAIAAVRFAVRDYAAEQKWTDTLETFDALVDDSVEKLSGRAYTRPPARRRRRNFL